jgi:hypothetical protein
MSHSGAHTHVHAHACTCSAHIVHICRAQCILHSAHAVPTPGIEELHVAVCVALLLIRRLGRVGRSRGCVVEGRGLRGGGFGSELGLRRCTHRLPYRMHVDVDVHVCMRMSMCTRLTSCNSRRVSSS